MAVHMRRCLPVRRRRMVRVWVRVIVRAALCDGGRNTGLRGTSVMRVACAAGKSLSGRDESVFGQRQVRRDRRSESLHRSYCR